MRGVSKRFGATVALSNVDLEVRPGEVHALLGENGAGKSTLMKILSGALAPDSGTLELDGERYSPSSPLDGRRAGVAMIYQELSIAPHLSVAENVLLGVEPTRGLRVLWGPLRDRARDALARVGRADIDLDQPAGRLPIADQQLVEIARSIALGARVVVLDEPTSSLAQEDVERLFRLIGELRDRGTSVVYISHFLEEAQQVADRYTVLRDGRVVGHGSMAGTSAAQLIELMAGRRPAPRGPANSSPAGDMVLQVRQLPADNLERCLSQLGLPVGPVHGDIRGAEPAPLKAVIVIGKRVPGDAQQRSVAALQLPPVGHCRERGDIDEGQVQAVANVYRPVAGKRRRGSGIEILGKSAIQGRGQQEERPQRDEVKTREERPEPPRYVALGEGSDVEPCQAI